MIRVKGGGYPLPHTVCTVSLEEVIQTGHKRPGGLTQVDGVVLHS